MEITVATSLVKLFDFSIRLTPLKAKLNIVFLNQIARCSKLIRLHLWVSSVA
jgi:hypothetical protein